MVITPLWCNVVIAIGTVKPSVSMIASTCSLVMIEALLISIDVMRPIIDTETRALALNVEPSPSVIIVAWQVSADRLG